MSVYDMYQQDGGRQVNRPNYTNSVCLTAPTYWHMFVTSLRVPRHCILIGVAIEPRIATT